MAKPKEPECDDKEQSKRFIDKAKELGSDESGKAFERAVDSISNTNTSKQKGNKSN